MPFTPIHMGPGILIKGVLQGSFSLMVFGWTQIVMDIQPLVVILTGEGHLHGFTHTYLGAILIAFVSAATGKYLSQIGLRILRIETTSDGKIAWSIAIMSAIIGSFSHVFLDSLMHSDLQPFFPVDRYNPFLGIVSVRTLHKLCLYSGLLGAGVYYGVQWRSRVKSNGSY